MTGGEAAQGVQGDYSRGEIINSVTVTYVSLAAIYFPSVTGTCSNTSVKSSAIDCSMWFTPAFIDNPPRLLGKVH